MRAVAALAGPFVVAARAAAGLFVVAARAATRRGLERCGRERGRFARTLFSSPGAIARPSLCSTSLTATSSRTWLLGALSHPLAAAMHVLGRHEWKSPRDGGYALAWQLERHFRVVTWSGLRRYVLTMAVFGQDRASRSRAQGLLIELRNGNRCQ